jgi:hypothetical protein
MKYFLLLKNNDRVDISEDGAKEIQRILSDKTRKKDEYINVGEGINMILIGDIKRIKENTEEVDYGNHNWDCMNEYENNRRKFLKLSQEEKNKKSYGFYKLLWLYLTGSNT